MTSPTASTLPCVCNNCTLFRPVDPNANIGVKFIIFVLNVFLTPAFLVYHCISFYFVPCVSAIIGNCLVNCLRCNETCFQWLMFSDKSFKPDDTSLGNLQHRPAVVNWIRLPDLVDKTNKKLRPMLFDNTIEAADVCQGGLGDCWLLAAFATLCEKKAFIQNCFITRCYNPRGKYIIRLYNRETSSFYNITIDDYIPCDKNNKPLFTQFNGQEMWPLLLEKAYAKSKGSYSAIEGGRPLDAMIELTGYLGETCSGPFNHHNFENFQKYINKGCLLAAGSLGVDNTRTHGRDKLKSKIVGGHAYSILDIKTPMLTTKKIRLLKVRNPWGSFEWDGDWSDNSPLWNKHTGVALEIGKPPEKEDGIFYMSWEDFCRVFDSVDVLYPAYGIDNLHYRVVEHDGYCGTCRGFVWGCLKYWLCFHGLRVLWLRHTSEELKNQLNNKEKKENEEDQHMLAIV